MVYSVLTEFINGFGQTTDPPPNLMLNTSGIVQFKSRPALLTTDDVCLGKPPLRDPISVVVPPISTTNPFWIPEEVN